MKDVLPLEITSILDGTSFNAAMPVAIIPSALPNAAPCRMEIYTTRISPHVER
jgi:hypothetical protein